jgi:ubiquitin-conjugating enzyme (huntingtin interacting protein 2)
MALGFEKSKVIEVMRRLNYRGANAAAVGEDAVVQALLS